MRAMPRGAVAVLWQQRFRSEVLRLKIFLQLSNMWAAIRWKMMIIFSFFSVVSVAMITCFSVALLNVVIRRESAFLIEERIKVIVESRKGIIDPVLDRINGCEYASNAALFSLF